MLTLKRINGRWILRYDGEIILDTYILDVALEVGRIIFEKRIKHRMSNQGECLK